MCTAVADGNFFGRTLDYGRSFGEQPIIAPRRFPLRFRRLPPLGEHYALLGMAAVEEGYPLFYEAINERGLGMAGLLFAGNAFYPPPRAGAENVGSFELIPWILGQCAELQEVRARLERLCICDLHFSAALPATPLHWIIASAEGSLILESTAAGLFIYENPIGVLTNNPPFPQQLLRQQDYARLSPHNAPEQQYSAGLGAIGLPGDFSSAGRFARAAFIRRHRKERGMEGLFRILGGAEVPQGCAGDRATLYTSVYDLAAGRMFYTTRQNRAVTALALGGADFEGERLLRYPLQQEQRIFWQN